MDIHGIEGCLVNFKISNRNRAAKLLRRHLRTKLQFLLLPKQHVQLLTSHSLDRWLVAPFTAM